MNKLLRQKTHLKIQFMADRTHKNQQLIERKKLLPTNNNFRRCIMQMTFLNSNNNFSLH